MVVISMFLAISFSSIHHIYLIYISYLSYLYIISTSSIHHIYLIYTSYQSFLFVYYVWSSLISNYQSYATVISMYVFRVDSLVSVGKDLFFGSSFKVIKTSSPSSPLVNRNELPILPKVINRIIKLSSLSSSSSFS